MIKLNVQFILGIPYTPSTLLLLAVLSDISVFSLALFLQLQAGFIISQADTPGIALHPPPHPHLASHPTPPPSPCHTPSPLPLPYTLPPPGPLLSPEVSSMPSFPKSTIGFHLKKESILVS